MTVKRLGSFAVLTAVFIWAAGAGIPLVRAATILDTESDYNSKCAVCHGASGTLLFPNRNSFTSVDDLIDIYDDVSHHNTVDDCNWSCIRETNAYIWEVLWDNPVCTDDDSDGYYAETGCGTVVDCDDAVAAVNPGASENCTDTLDNDCDGIVDCSDSDCSGDAACKTCTDADADGYYAEADCGIAMDCDDANAAVNPGADENCADLVDNDCDGGEDCADSDCTDDSACASCIDADEDTYFAVEGCGSAVDCDDTNASVNPGVDEIADDGVDNDCDGDTDETCTDADEDGYFEEAGCGTSVDCEDTNAAVNPGADEVPGDDIDNNCNGETDEGCTDADNDSYYAEEGCGTAVDCDDANAAVNPGADEVTDDGIDNDCDGKSLTTDDSGGDDNTGCFIDSLR